MDCTGLNIVEEAMQSNDDIKTKVWTYEKILGDRETGNKDGVQSIVGYRREIVGACQCSKEGQPHHSGEVCSRKWTFQSKAEAGWKQVGQEHHQKPKEI